MKLITNSNCQKTKKIFNSWFDLNFIMSFDEKNARRIINLLLENDIASYKNWLKEIKLFDSAQLENLLNGNNEYSYHVSNEKSFQKVIM